MIEVHGLSAGYGTKTILQDLDFTVARGEVFGILGGSGCGKSTLLRVLVGLLPPMAGTVLVDGVDLTAVQAAERAHLLTSIGVSFQSGALFGSMTLSENVRLPLDAHSPLPVDAREQVARMKLAIVGLAGFEQHLPSEISGGMRKRAALARALALDPPILFLDEPSAGLDPVTAAGIDKLIVQLAEVLGTTLVMVTHELNSIYAVLDRCILLDGDTRGVIAMGQPKELRDHSDDPRVLRFFRRLTVEDQPSVSVLPHSHD